MCDEEAEYTCPVWDEVDRVARKEHACSGCGETIKPGHQYRRTAILASRKGGWSTWRHCRRCAAMIDALRPYLDECFTTEVLDLDCGEVWKNPPDDVAALAFVLPGEPVTALLGGVP
jgi:hypothetical protein